jgi:sulfoacetaldehyde dehydrogenase
MRQRHHPVAFTQGCRRLREGCSNTAEFDKIGLDHDLVQMVPALVTGSQDNVRRAYSSGTPAIGVGAGNVTVIVDETADLAAAAGKITASKCFDNATSCSSENVLVVVDEAYDSSCRNCTLPAAACSMRPTRTS